MRYRCENFRAIVFGGADGGDRSAGGAISSGVQGGPRQPPTKR